MAKLKNKEKKNLSEYRRVDLDNYNLLEDEDQNQQNIESLIEIENKSDNTIINNIEENNERKSIYSISGNKNMIALLFDIRFNAFVRWFTLVLLISNVAMFISGHTVVGAAVRFNGYVAMQHIISNSLLDFSLIDSIVKMWQAKV